MNQKAEELYPDDEIWLNKHEMDNVGKNGIKVTGKWYIRGRDRVMLRINITNTSTEVYRSPRIDISSNFYGLTFLKEGVGIPMKSIEPGANFLIDKGSINIFKVLEIILRNMFQFIFKR